MGEISPILFILKGCHHKQLLILVIYILVIIKQLVKGDQDECSVTVAKDGTGSYWSVNEAVIAAPSYSKTRYYVCIRSEVYMENVFVGRDKTNSVFVCDGSTITKITASRHAPDFSTSFSATVSEFYFFCFFILLFELSG